VCGSGDGKVNRGQAPSPKEMAESEIGNVSIIQLQPIKMPVTLGNLSGFSATIFPFLLGKCPKSLGILLGNVSSAMQCRAEPKGRKTIGRVEQHLSATCSTSSGSSCPILPGPPSS